MEPSVTMAPRLLRDHLAGEGAAAMHGAVVIDLPHAVVRRHVHVHDGLGVGDQPGRGDEDIGRPRSFSILRRPRLDRLRVRYIAGIEAPRQRLGDGLAARLVDVDDGDGADPSCW